MKDQIILITGASTGIGAATALALAHQSARLVLVSRNEQRGQQALQTIRQEVPAAALDFIPCDLSSLADVRRLAADFQQRYDRLDVLVNNAGILPGKYTETPDGFELGWATNHLGPFLLTNLLLNHLQKAEQGRIVNVSSEAHRLGKIAFNRTMARQPYRAFTAYCDSKLANVLFTYELARRLERTPVTANALHPGVIASSFGSTGQGVWKWLFQVAGRPFMQNATQGAATPVYLATAPGLNHTTGLYFKNKKPLQSSALSYDQPLARRLWQVSAEQTGLANPTA